MTASKMTPDCTLSTQVAGLCQELKILAHVVGLTQWSDRRHLAQGDRFVGARGLNRLERVARQHLGTAAVAVLQGVVYR
jgi:hypothetical protein